MNYQDIENLFIDFILDIIGPSNERENERNSCINIITEIALKPLRTNFPEYDIYIFPYGSFPSKSSNEESRFRIRRIAPNRAMKSF